MWLDKTRFILNTSGTSLATFSSILSQSWILVSCWEGKRLLKILSGADSMKPNILKFWFWRARLMVAGLYDGKDSKPAKIQINDELTIELHPANGAGGRPFIKLCRTTGDEQQTVTIYLKEIPALVEMLPKTVAS
jgi:hypothetical protein